MISFAYKAFQEPAHQGFYACNRHSDDYPLLVNITGQIHRDNSHSDFIERSQACRKDFYLMFLINGQLNVYIDSDRITIDPNTILLFPPHYKYRYEYVSKAGPMTYMYVHFTGSYAGELLKSIDIYPFPFIKELIPISSNEIKKGFNRLFDAFAEENKYRQYIASCALERLLLTLANSNTYNNTTLKESISFIHNHYNEKLVISELAKKEAICNSLYIKKFKLLYGISPSKYIINLRLSIACDLLSRTDMHINEIGVQVGYPDSAFFCKIFKKNIGLSPKEYRSKYTTME